MRKQIEIPKTCPSCNSTLILINAQLFCKNIICSARSAKNIEHFAKTIGIKGLGPSTIKQLGINHYVELYGLSLQSLIEILDSEKKGNKLYEEIQRSKDADFATIIASFGIPKIGKTVASKLSTVSSILDLSKQKCMELGLGNIASDSLMDFINYEFKEIESLLPFPQLYNNVEVTNKPIVKTIVCITGKLKSFKTKTEAKSHLEAIGILVSDDVTKSINYLIDEDNKNSIKRQKAEEFGIPIVTNLLTFIEEKTHEYKKMD